MMPFSTVDLHPQDLRQTSRFRCTAVELLQSSVLFHWRCAILDCCGCDGCRCINVFMVMSNRLPPAPSTTLEKSLRVELLAHTFNICMTTIVTTLMVKTVVITRTTVTNRRDGSSSLRRSMSLNECLNMNDYRWPRCIWRSRCIQCMRGCDTCGGFPSASTVPALRWVHLHRWRIHRSSHLHLNYIPSAAGSTLVLFVEDLLWYSNQFYYILRYGSYW